MRRLTGPTSMGPKTGMLGALCITLHARGQAGHEASVRTAGWQALLCAGPDGVSRGAALHTLVFPHHLVGDGMAAVLSCCSQASGRLWSERDRP